MRRIITAREQAEALAPWRIADWKSDQANREWAFNTLTPKQQRKQYEKSIKDKDTRAEWDSRPKKDNPNLETGPEYLDQPTLPGMEKIRGESTRLWRGIPVDTHDPAFRRVWQMTYGQGQPVDDPGMFPDADLRYQDRGGEFDHPGLADAILDGFAAKGGVGEHHSIDFNIADAYGRGVGEASELMSNGYYRGRDLPVLLDSDWNGRGEDLERSGSGNVYYEQEIMLKQHKAPITIRDLRIPHNVTDAENFKDWSQEWNSILQDSRDITAAHWGMTL